MTVKWMHTATMVRWEDEQFIGIGLAHAYPVKADHTSVCGTLGKDFFTKEWDRKDEAPRRCKLCERKLGIR